MFFPIFKQQSTEMQYQSFFFQYFHPIRNHKSKANAESKLLPAKLPVQSVEHRGLDEFD